MSTILYAEEEAGFMAGYAAVKTVSQTRFSGGMAVPEVIRYGHGFTECRGCCKGNGSCRRISFYVYNFSGDFAASPESQKSSQLVPAGQVYVACGSAVGNSVIAAAEETDESLLSVQTLINMLI